MIGRCFVDCDKGPPCGAIGNLAGNPHAGRIKDKQLLKQEVHFLGLTLQPGLQISKTLPLLALEMGLRQFLGITRFLQDFYPRIWRNSVHLYALLKTGKSWE